MKRLFALLAVSALAACASTTGREVTDAQVAEFRSGEATEAHVVARLGPPTMRLRMGDGSVSLIYSHADVKIKGATFIPIVGLFAGGSDVRASSVTLRFGPDGRLVDTASAQNAYGTSGTGAMQAPDAGASTAVAK